ncbi:hypothetical protein OHC33_001412 [Knufia fluminis]|uniref:Uncharacterized protein n=1 Tax=Knufia fluminis TaxID=191047 RepID=A0AAN8F5H8_9EURO|nr:hypothetical protein OHC33_001412 [Knufia fluminis]
MSASFQSQTSPAPFGTCIICNAIEPRTDIQWCTKCPRTNHRSCTVALGRSGGLTSDFCDRCLIPGARHDSGGSDQNGSGGGGDNNQNEGQDGKDKAPGQGSAKQNEGQINGDAARDGVHVNGS